MRRSAAALAASAWTPAGLARVDDPPPGLVVRRDRPFNAETPPAALDPFLTPADRLFVRNHGDPPALGDADPRTWRIDLGGLVDRAGPIAVGDLDKFDRVTLTALLQCSGNGRAYYRPAVPGDPWERGAVGNGEWSGVRLRDLLRQAGLRDDARHVHLRGADEPTKPGDPPWVRSLPIDRALAPDTLVATHLNGEPLPHAHGGPVRLVVPGWSGNHWMKWLTAIRPESDPATGEFMDRAYRMPTAPVDPGAAVDPATMTVLTTYPVKSLITNPLPGARPVAGVLEVAGWSWSGAGPITKVELSLDGGPWLPAELVGPDTPPSWRRWQLSTPLSAGPHALRCRATDSTGAVQPERSPWNPKGYLWNGYDEVTLEAVG